MPPSYLQEYDKKTILVTGGLGFIGSNLVHRLSRATQAEIRVVDSLNPWCGGNPRNLDGLPRTVQIQNLDLRDGSRLRELVRQVDLIFNLAGQVSHIDSMNDPIQDLKSNAEAHLSLLETCRHHNPGARIVYSSTRQVYGRASNLPAGECHPILPTDINGINKFAGESYHRIYHQVHGLATCSLRLTNTYGPRQLIRHSRQGFIGWFIHQIMNDEEVILFGDGRRVRDLNYVDCVVDALLLAGIHPRAPGQVYNLGSGEPITLLDIVNLMIGIAGKGSYRIEPFPEERRRIDIGNFYSDFSRIREELGWEPRVCLREGLTRTMEFFEQHRKVYLEETHANLLPRTTA